ncbi:MAG: hypothetical protein JWR61_1302 [Ferruginibacter sp.]|nr:hypothetical protein [Ferruginibacter sp.]
MLVNSTQSHKNTNVFLKAVALMQQLFYWRMLMKYR